MATLTVARKIAATSLAIWKKGEKYDLGKAVIRNKVDRQTVTPVTDLSNRPRLCVANNAAEKGRGRVSRGFLATKALVEGYAPSHDPILRWASSPR